MIKSIILALRPKQWIKNLLVAAAPLAAGEIQENTLPVVIGIFGFICASILGYVINDWLDRDFDRLHATKKNRPFASSELGLISLLSISLSCIVGALISAYFLPPEYLSILGIYFAVTVLYSIIIKHQPVVEMLWLSSSFLIRAIAGSTIISKSPTGWFLICVFFGALFVVATKRLAEFKSPDGRVTREVLKSYSMNYLQTISTTSLTVTTITYALWAFDMETNKVIAQISILPFVTSLYLFSLQSESDDAQRPEDLLFRSPAFIFSALLTIFCLVLVFYK